MRAGQWVGVAVLVLLVLGACKPAAEPASKPPEASPMDAANRKVSWPPEVGRPYPDLTLLDGAVRTVRLSSYKGKVLLIEPIGMNCPACIRMAGAGKRGVGDFSGIAPESGSYDTDDYLSWFGVDPDDERFVYVHLLLYGLTMRGPTAEDARKWSEHFNIARHRNWVVLAGGEGMVNPASSNLIPGYQLVDKDFVLRYDAAGHKPRDSVDALFPAIADLLGQ